MQKSLRSLLTLMFIMWLSHLLADFMIGIWSVYKTIAGIDLAIAGLIAGGSAFIGESLQAYFGPMTDRGYRQKLVIVGLLMTLMSCLMPYTQNYGVLFVFYLLTCIGSGAFHPAAVSVMNELSDRHKALFMTIFQSGGSLGLAFSQFVFSQTYFMLEGQTLILAIPSALLVSLILWQGYGKQKSFVPSADVKKPNNWKSLGQLLRKKELSSLYITQLCNQSLFWGTIFILPDILLSRGYDDWLCFGGAHLFLTIGGASMMVPAGFLADKYSCRKVILASFFIGLLSFYTFLANPFLSPLALCSLLFILGAALGTVSPVVVALGNRFSPKNSGMVSALLMGMVWCVAEGIGQGGTGLLTKLFTDHATAYALACLGLLFFIGTFTTWKLPKIEQSLEMELA